MFKLATLEDEARLQSMNSDEFLLNFKKAGASSVFHENDICYIVVNGIQFKMDFIQSLVVNLLENE